MDDNDRASTSGTSGAGAMLRTSVPEMAAPVRAHAHGPAHASEAGDSSTSSSNSTNGAGFTSRSSAIGVDLPPMPVPYEDFQFSLDLPEEVSFSDIELVRSPNFNDLFGMSTSLASLGGASSSSGQGGAEGAGGTTPGASRSQSGGGVGSGLTPSASALPMSLASSSASASAPSSSAPVAPGGAPSLSFGSGASPSVLLRSPDAERAGFALRPPPPPDFDPPPGASLFSFDDAAPALGAHGRDVSMDSANGSGAGAGGRGPPPGGGAGGGGIGGAVGSDEASNLFNAQESNFLTNFLEGFDWDFQPVLPEGLPSFADAERGSIAMGLDRLASPPGTSGAGSASSAGGRASRPGRPGGAAGRKGHHPGIGGGAFGSGSSHALYAAHSPAGASDATSPRPGSGTSDATAIGGPGGGSGGVRSPSRILHEDGAEGDADAWNASQRKRRTTEAARAAARERSAGSGHDGSPHRPVSLMGGLVPVSPNGANGHGHSGAGDMSSLNSAAMMDPAQAHAQAQLIASGMYPPQHPHAAIMQAAAEGNFSHAFPWLPPGSLALPPASFDPTQQQQHQQRTRTFDQMMTEDQQQQAQLSQQQQQLAQQAAFAQQQQHIQQQMQLQAAAAAAAQGHAQAQAQGQGPASGHGHDGSGAEPEKRQHHIFSEQRRRTNIREGFKELVELLELGRFYGARGLGLASGAGTGIEDEGLDDRSDDEEDEEGSGLPRRKKGAKARNRKAGGGHGAGGPGVRGKGKGRGRGGSAGGGAGSKSAVLFQAVDLLRWLHERNRLIEQQCGKIEALLPANSAKAEGGAGSAMQM